MRPRVHRAHRARGCCQVPLAYQAVNQELRLAGLDRINVAIIEPWTAASYFSHHAAPHLTDRISANIACQEIDLAPPAPPTQGSLFQPMEAGCGVDDGVRTRMRAEGAARKGR